MTIQRDVEQAIETTFFTKGSDGKDRFGREIDQHLDRRLGHWFLTGGFAVFVFISGFVWWAASQEARISELDRRVDDNAAAIATRLDDIITQLNELRSILIESSNSR